MSAADEKRLLRFHPVDNPSPRLLSREQIAAYNRQGYLKPFDIFTAEEAQENRRYFDALLAEVRQANDGRDEYSINGYHRQCRKLWDVVTHPVILDLVQDLLGPAFVCWGTHYFCKMPGDPRAVPWHQDASYWPLSPSKTVTVWLAIDDADRDNGAMKVLPGTHLLGHLAWEPTQKAAVLNQEIQNPQQYGEPVHFELRAGQISLHSDLLVHGSDPNTSSRRRCGLTARYASMEVRALVESWAKGAIWCRGQDLSGHWSNLPRPASESVQPLEWQRRKA